MTLWTKYFGFIHPNCSMHVRNVILHFNATTLWWKQVNQWVNEFVGGSGRVEASDMASLREREGWFVNYCMILIKTHLSEEERLVMDEAGSVSSNHPHTQMVYDWQWQHIPPLTLAFPAPPEALTRLVTMGSMSRGSLRARVMRSAFRVRILWNHRRI